MTFPRIARSTLLGSVSVLSLAACMAAARAQSVDYGSLEQLYGEPVTTSATGKPQKASEVPANMEIITQDDIRRSGADNLPDILQFVTGLDVRRYGFADSSVSIRGMNQPQSPRLLVLVNGRQVYQDDYGYVAWQAIPVQLDEIRQIEIVKGPNSALFGFNAVSGVVNIITYDPLLDNKNVVTARAGTQNLVEGDVVTTVHPTQDVGVRVSAGGFMAHEFRNPYRNTISAENPKAGTINADAKARVATGVEMSLSASEASSQSLGIVPLGSLWNEYWRTSSVRAGLAGESPIGTLGLSVYRNELFYSAYGYGGTVPWRNIVYVVQASDIVKPSSDHTLRFGLEFRDNTTKDVNIAFINGQVGYDVYAASVMWNWQITPELSLTNAVRGDYLKLSRSGPQPTANGYTNAQFNNRSIFEPSVNSGLVYQPTDADTFRLTAAQGIGVPSLIQFGYSAGAAPNLNPTIVDNFEIGYDRKVAAIDSVIRTSLFYETNRNLLITIGGPAPAGAFFAPSQNIGSANELGWEIGISGHSPSGFRWKASYALANVTEHVITNRNAVPDAPFDYMNGTPQHTVILGLGYSWEKWEFDVNARWQSEYRDYISAGLFAGLKPKLVSNYITASARIGYNIKENITLALTAQQFDSASLATTASLPIERQIIGSVTAHF
jgi:iron complex outermembrane receptor protein